MDFPRYREPEIESKPVSNARVQRFTSIDLLVCLLLPPAGIIAGLVRLVRRDPTAGRMIFFSALMIFLTAFLSFVILAR